MDCACEEIAYLTCIQTAENGRNGNSKKCSENDLRSFTTRPGQFNIV